ncbi:MAG: BatA domain-containing protein [Planctomycetota bacterium]
MPLFLNSLMLAGMALAGVPVAIHLFYRLRRRRVIFPALRFLQKTNTVHSARLKLRDLLLLLCRVLAVLCLVVAFARPYFIGQQLEAGVESGAVDLVVVVDNSASMSYKPDQVSRLEMAREAALRLIAKRQSGDRVGVLEATRPNDPVLRLDGVLSRAVAAVKNIPQRFGADRPLDALTTACNSFADDPADKHTHRVVILSDMQAAHWPAADLARRIAPLVDKFHVEVQLVDLSDPTPGNPAVLSVGSSAPRVTAPSPDTAVTGIHVDLAGYAPHQAAPVTVTVHRVDTKPAGVLPVKLSVLHAEPGGGTGTGTAPGGGNDRSPGATVLGSLTMAGSGDAQVTLAPRFESAGWQAVRAEVLGRDALPADDVAYAVARLTDRPSILVVEGAADDDEVREDETRGQSYFVAEALRANVGDESSGGAAGGGGGGAGHEFNVKVIAPAALTSLALAGQGGVVLCGVSSLGPTQVESLERFAARGGQVLIFAARVKPGTPGTLRPPDDLTNRPFYNSAFYRGGRGLIGVRFDPPPPAADQFIVSPNNWDRHSDIFAPFTAPDAGDPTAFSVYGQMAVNAQDLAEITARPLLSAAAARAGSTPTGRSAAPSTATPPPEITTPGTSGPGTPAFSSPAEEAGDNLADPDDPGRGGAQVIEALSPTRPFMLDRPYGAGRVLTVFGAARPEWTNWIRKRNFLPVIRQWGRRVETHGTAGANASGTGGTNGSGAGGTSATGAGGSGLQTSFYAGAEPTVGEVFGMAPPSKTGKSDGAGNSPDAGAPSYYLQQPDPAQPFAAPPVQSNPLRIENLTLNSTLDLDRPGLYYLGAISAEGTPPPPVPIAVSIDPAEAVLTPAAPGALLAALASSAVQHPEHHTITAESSDAAKRSSQLWIWLAGGVALLLLLEQLLRDTGFWRGARRTLVVRTAAGATGEEAASTSGGTGGAGGTGRPVEAGADGGGGNGAT